MLTLTLLAPSTLLAQDGLHSVLKPGDRPLSVATEEAEVELALRGFCPVSLVEGSKWVPGEAKLTAVYDGLAYRFPDERLRKVFLADPVQYAPALGGDDVVHFAKTGDRLPGELANGAVHDGRLYFFATERNRKAFVENREKYLLSDMALGGDCVVTLVERRQRLPGEEELTILHGGIRYRFAGAKELRTFVAAPEKFVEVAERARSEAE